MALILINQSQKRMPKTFIIEWIEQIRQVLKKRGIKIPAQAQLTLVFMDPKEARALNLKYRKRNYATDVLSFLGDGTNSLGELVLCSSVIEKQAVEHQLSYREELGYMVLHGILHLLGFDHETSKSDALKMFTLQDEVFDKLCRKFWK